MRYSLLRSARLAGLLLLPAVGACQHVKPLSGDEMRVTGTVELTQVGVGCWRLAGTDDKNYELRKDQVPSGLLVEGRKVTLVVKPRTDLMSSCQVGQIVDVVRSED